MKTYARCYNMRSLKITGRTGIRNCVTVTVSLKIMSPNLKVSAPLTQTLSHSPPDYHLFAG